MAVTVNAGSSATFGIDAAASLTITNSGRDAVGVITFTSAAPDSGVPSFTAPIQEKVWGPFLAPMQVTIAVTNGTCIYQPNGNTGGFGYDTSGNITGLVDQDGNVVDLGGGTFTQAGTGAIVRTPQDKLREVVSVADFGAIGNASTGDDAVFQAAIDYLSKISDDTGIKGTLEFDGVIYLSGQIKIGKNITLRGKGRNFRSQISLISTWTGASVFAHNGADCIGGYSFRIRHENYTLNCTNRSTAAQVPILYYIKSAYDVMFDNVTIYNGLGTGVHVEDTNWVVINGCSFYGNSADATVSNIAVRVASGGTIDNTGGGVKIVNSDIEVWFTGVSNESDGRCELVNPYIERCITGWKNTNTAYGTMLVTGGQVASPGASGIAANISGPNCTVIGGYYAANGGKGLFTSTTRYDNTHILGVAGDVWDVRNLLRKLGGVDTLNWYPSKARSYKTPADNVATTFFTITCPYVSSNFGSCDVTVHARDVAGYSLWTANYRFAFSNVSGTASVTSVTEYGKANVNISGNYSLSITAALSVSGASIDFQLTCNTGGALGDTVAPRVSAEASLLQWDSAGAVYIVAA